VTQRRVRPDGWNSATVATFADGRDPIEKAKEVASALIGFARDNGLLGPPVDVVGLAELLGFDLSPRDDLMDAQLVPSRPAATSPIRVAPSGVLSPAAGMTIEYNPSRPRGRLRFSIAHEIAHACFADVSDRPRHRTAVDAIAGGLPADSWELELLCNVIAAELLVPDAAVEGLMTVDPDIDFIMESRRRWDVSTEALLRRLVSNTPRDMLLVAGARPTESVSSLRVDYVEAASSAGSKKLESGFSRGSAPASLKVFSRITAVGQTERAISEVRGKTLSMQAVGVPPYPGSRYPRVMILVEPAEQRATDERLVHVLSDLVEVPPDDSVLFAHVVSDSVRAWGRFGSARSLALKYPDFAQAYRSWSISSPENLVLGNVHSVGREIDGRWVGVASLVAQEGFGRGEVTRLRYDALDEALARLAEEALQKGATVHIPRLGAGQAGGRWDVVEASLVKQLTSKNIDVVVHTLPARQRGVDG
jgi:hypothetical protein